MIKLNNLILDYKKINLINKNNFKTESIENNSLISIGKFISSYNSIDEINNLLLDEIDNKIKLNVLKIEIEEFIKNYDVINSFIQSLDKRKIEQEILNFYDNNVIFIMNLQKKELYDNYCNFAIKIKENASVKLTNDEKNINIYNYVQAREKFEKIDNEINKINIKIIRNIPFIYYKYELIFSLSNHIKKNLYDDINNIEIYFDMEVLGGLYKLCNGFIFEDTSEDTFRNFFNLKGDTISLIMKKGKRQYVHYIIRNLYEINKTSKNIDFWLNSILEYFGWGINEHRKRRNIINSKIEELSKNQKPKGKMLIEFDIFFKFYKK